MDTNVYSLVQSQRATAVNVTECVWGKTERARGFSSFGKSVLLWNRTLIDDMEEWVILNYKSSTFT